MRPLTRSRLPYRPRGRATARRRPFASHGAAPWLGAPGRVAAARRRVGAQRPAPAGPFTITAPRASPSRRGGQRQLPEGRCREPATARFGPLLQRGASGSQPESERSSLSRAPASHQLLRLRGTRLPRTLRSTLRAPRLQPQFLSKSPASVSHARPDCSLRSRLPKDRLPPPRPPQQPPQRLAPDQEELASGVASGRGTCHPPGSAPRRASPPPFVCTPRTPPRSPFGGAALRAKAKERGSAGQPGDWKGAKGDSTHFGKVPACCCLWASSWSRPYPGFPAPPGPGRRGTGEERSHRERVGNGASGAAGKGLKNCFGFAKEI